MVLRQELIERIDSLLDECDRFDAMAGKFNCVPGKTIPCGNVCRTPPNCKKHLRQNPPALPQNPKLIPKKTVGQKLSDKVASLKQKVSEAIKGKPKPTPREVTAEEALPEIEFQDGRYVTKDLGDGIPSRRQKIRATQLLFSAQEKKVPSDEEANDMVRAIDYFTGDGYGEMRALQMGKYEEPPPKERMQKYVDDAENFIRNSPKFDGQVYRGMNFDTEAAFSQFIQANSGGFELNAMSSFSATQSVAESFMEGNLPGSVKVLVSVSRNKSGASVKPFSEFPTEDEVLVPSGTKYRVKSQKREGNTVRLEWEEI